jgi:UDP-2-acetamido-3-amino-2,3-dideoxy-glucuronate N-acetyltransferase
MSDYFVHQSTCLEDKVTIGQQTSIGRFCYIKEGASIGEGCIIEQNVFIDTGVVVGNRVKIQNNGYICSGVTCEDDVLLAPSVVFADTVTPRVFIKTEQGAAGNSTLIKTGATIGANATIVAGITIGSYAFIGAGAVVRHDVPDYGLVYGNPAKLQGWVCQCGQKLDFIVGIADCDHCHKRYTAVSDISIAEIP